MKTNVKATNWPSRDAARHNTPRESRRGECVASPRKHQARLKVAVTRSMPELLERAARHFARVAAVAAQKRRP